ncbi:MAG TPA: DNA adenine methylase, partial [Acidiferrobacteraceae bacterium]|nr:DNA adenine methylase [Acidiferrobacteraceae bacterium]
MTAHAAAQPRYPALRPLLKWAGGKTQMLELLRARMPRLYGRYLEPFVGGGALFFAVAPQQGLIADSNPELVNLYRTVAQDVGGILKCLREYDSSKETFYALRALDWQQLTPAAAAARTLFLNRLCFNGLYRVNRAGHFNVPYGRYKNPRLVDETALRAASVLLQDTTIVCGDYRQVLQEHARAGDFVFLDPPYLPLSAYADFKRYTREPFQEQDHLALADEVRRLYALGCHVLLTNSNHPLVHAQYQGFAIEVVPTRRAISCNGAARSGEDVLVQATPAARDRQRTPTPLDPQVRRYPPTRYMG